MEELDERAFLYGIQVYRYGGGLAWVRRVDLYFLRVLSCIESLIWQGSPDVG
jgi:hypothetical protein